MPIDESLEQDESGVLDSWLEESGRRKHSADWVASLYTRAQKPSAPAARRPRHYVTQPALLCLFAIAALAYAMHYFIEVELAIGSLRNVIVFVALK